MIYSDASKISINTVPYYPSKIFFFRLNYLRWSKHSSCRSMFSLLFTIKVLLYFPKESSDTAAKLLAHVPSALGDLFHLSYFNISLNFLKWVLPFCQWLNDIFHFCAVYSSPHLSEFFSMFYYILSVNPPCIFKIYSSCSICKWNLLPQLSPAAYWIKNSSMYFFPIWILIMFLGKLIALFSSM